MPTEKNLWFTVQGPQKTQTSWHLNCHAGHHSNSLHVNASRHKRSINGTKETEQNEIDEDLLQAPLAPQGTDSSVQELHPSGELPSGGFWHFFFCFFTCSLCFGTSPIISQICSLKGKRRLLFGFHSYIIFILYYIKVN